jgi:hypothetical protein
MNKAYIIIGIKIYPGINTTMEIVDVYSSKESAEKRIVELNKEKPNNTWSDKEFYILTKDILD